MPSEENKTSFIRAWKPSPVGQKDVGPERGWMPSEENKTSFIRAWKPSPMGQKDAGPERGWIMMSHILFLIIIINLFSLGLDMLEKMLLRVQE